MLETMLQSMVDTAQAAALVNYFDPGKPRECTAVPLSGPLEADEEDMYPDVYDDRLERRRDQKAPLPGQNESLTARSVLHLLEKRTGSKNRPVHAPGLPFGTSSPRRTPVGISARICSTGIGGNHRYHLYRRSCGGPDWIFLHDTADLGL